MTTRTDWSAIFAENIKIAFNFKINGSDIPLEFEFKQPTDEDHLELLTSVDNIDKLAELAEKENIKLDDMENMKESELLKMFAKDKDLITSVTAIKKGYGAMMSKHFVSGSGFNKKSHKNFETYYKSLHSLVRETLYEQFMTTINSEKKRGSVVISSDSTSTE